MLQNNSLIVSLSVSMWTARRLDKTITNEVHTTHNASDDAGRYNKLLVSKQHTEPISKVANKARTFHYENTLAWGDNNERLLPAANYFEYVSKMNSLKDEFEQAVAAFLRNYDNVINEARVRLNGMFRQSDYPTRYEIESKFNYRTTFMPVPDTDFRLSLNDAEVEKLKAELGLEISNRLSAAVKGIWERIADQLKRMKERLADSDNVFRDSLFENLNELLILLPKLNVTNDPHIASITREMVQLVADPAAVRTNHALRRDIANEVDSVMNKFNGFFS